MLLSSNNREEPTNIYEPSKNFPHQSSRRLFIYKHCYSQKTELERLNPQANLSIEFCAKNFFAKTFTIICDKHFSRFQIACKPLLFFSLFLNIHFLTPLPPSYSPFYFIKLNPRTKHVASLISSPFRIISL